ncbi:hypothetical protein TYRP_013846 [Tyrophagus putrescentiae]|nr:hypothetical protein TYRP_013846 [Tyrophagus putrescentiae]
MTVVYSLMDSQQALFKLNIDDYAAVSHHREGGPGGPGDSLFQRNLRTLAVGLMSGELFEGGDKAEDDHLQGHSLEEGVRLWVKIWL